MNKLSLGWAGFNAIHRICASSEEQSQAKAQAKRIIQRWKLYPTLGHKIACGLGSSLSSMLPLKEPVGLWPSLELVRSRSLRPCKTAHRRMEGERMIRPKLVLFAYQLRRALSDVSTSILLLCAPSLTLRLMRMQSPPDALLFLSCICSPRTSSGRQSPCAMTSFRDSTAPCALSLPAEGDASITRGWTPTR
jgi:hypothetical protein